MPAWYFNTERGRELLKKQFGLNNLEAWGIENEPAVLSACNALLSYVANTQCESLPYIAPLELQRNPTSSFWMPQAAETSKSPRASVMTTVRRFFPSWTTVFRAWEAVS
ncbi:MAG: hypothetical protein V8R49_04990 [Duodenibacillus massiliensis]